jgi:hypothetical protein
MKPLVLLDIDGVLNAYPDEGTEGHELNWMGWRIYVGEDTLEALRSVFTNAHEVVWCSAWREMANVEPLEFLRWAGVTKAKKLSVVTDGASFPMFNREWKLDAVLRSFKVKKAIKDGRPIIWIEDFGWSLEHEYSPIKYMDVVLAGINPIDTAEKGRLTPVHLAETALESTSDIGDRAWDEYIAMSNEQEGGMG